LNDSHGHSLLCATQDGLLTEAIQTATAAKWHHRVGTTEPIQNGQRQQITNVLGLSSVLTSKKHSVQIESLILLPATQERNELLMLMPKTALLLRSLMGAKSFTHEFDADSSKPGRIWSGC